MQSQAQTVAEYLRELPADRRQIIQAVRQVILTHLPEGYEERMIYGMIGYVVPHRLYPAGYHCDPKLPLSYANLASQKDYVSLYLMAVYGHPPTEKWFREAWEATGKKLNMGKCCVRFKKLEDVPLEVVGQLIARVSVANYIARVEASLQERAASKAKPKKAAAKAAPSKKNAKKG